LSYRTKLWRTLIRVADIIDTSCYVVIPAWNSFEWVYINMSNIPENIRPLLCRGKRLHAEVNIDEEDKGNLKFENWEKE
jgi:hypothetical protein